MKLSIEDIVSTTIKANSGKLANQINETNALRERLLASMPPPKPLTRWERLQHRLQDARDALRVLRGEASYIEWYDE